MKILAEGRTLKKKVLKHSTGMSCMLILGLAVPCASAQTLDEAIRATLRTNPDVLASRYSVTAAEELKNQARGGYFPRLDVVLAGGRERSNNTTTRALDKDDASRRVAKGAEDAFNGVKGHTDALN